jgi:large subunit ribosomal protein L30
MSNAKQSPPPLPVKGASKSKVLVKLVRSGSRATKFQLPSLKGLGLRKINDVSEREDTPAVRGMITKVAHLVTVEKI